MTTIIIPAHNESRTIGRLLRQIVPTSPIPDLNIIVIANGCTDDTADIARSFGQSVQVISIPDASKQLALKAGDLAAASFPRIYVDADVELGLPDIRALEAELRRPAALATAPRRVVALDGCPWSVRRYYDVWTRLPQVRGELFGRGAFAVSEEGHRRLAALPPLMADDLAASLSFSPAERSIAAGAEVTYYPPRRFADLVRRRVRAATGVAQIERTPSAPASSQRTRLSDLVRLARDEPSLLPSLACFTMVTVLARTAARRPIARGDYSTWLRDESSRGAAAILKADKA
ncbi:MAG TPA: glycosyltransferase [Streptosporangiaceae bacterium]|nr:glycosyltransferase [Streptosporangiaceae bacterium]